MAPQSVPAMQLSTTFRGTSLVVCLFLLSPAGVGELPLAQATVLVDEPIMILTSFLIFSLLSLFNWTLGAQSSAPVRVSTSASISCWMKALSMVIFKIIISLITGQVKIGPLSSIAQGPRWGHPFGLLFHLILLRLNLTVNVEPG